MNRVCLIKKEKFDYKGLRAFLKEINGDFPIPLKDKIDFDLFLNKIQKKGEVFCIYDHHKIVGCLFFYANNYKNKIAFLTLLGVLKEYRHQHIATNLLKTMISYCFELNFDFIQLYTHQTNEEAILFYMKNGFYKIECDRIGDLKLEIALKEAKK